MPTAKWSQTFAEYSLCLVALSIPFPFIYSAISIGILTIAWIAQLNFKDTFINLKERKALWLWIIFYCLHAISYYYSDNKAQSSFDLQQKISFCILPIVIGAGITINKKALERIFFTFIFGLTAISLFCLTYAGWKWYQAHDTSVFFYHSLISGLEANAVYMAWYCIFSISLLLFNKWEYFLKSKTIKIIIATIQIVFFILLSSRMLIALFFVILIPFYIKKISNNISRIKIFASLALFILLLLSIALTKNPIRDRYENLYNVGVEQAFLNNYSNVAEGDFSNLTLRLFLWRVGIMNMNEHNLWFSGAGNGDVPTLQNNKMAEMGIRNIFEPIYTSPLHNANLHNMYMQSLLMIGIQGFIVFFLITFLPLLNINKIIMGSSFLIFHITAIAFMMQEAALQTQAGVVYYTFFSLIFWNIKHTTPK